MSAPGLQLVSQSANTEAQSATGVNDGNRLATAGATTVPASCDEQPAWVSTPVNPKTVATTTAANRCTSLLLLNVA